MCYNTYYCMVHMLSEQLLHACNWLQGVPGFSFTIARKEALLACKGNARSTSLDLFAQWEALEKPEGQFRCGANSAAL